jgi:hydrogenase maturation protein HypF
MLADLRTGVAPAACAARFHNGLAAWAGAVVEQSTLLDVVLSGGCFLNGLLTERVLEAVGRRGRRVYHHSTIPPNDGGLAVGQLAVALARRVPR